MLDCNGKRLKVGDIVELVDIPLGLIDSIDDFQCKGIVLEIVRYSTDPDQCYLHLDNAKISGLWAHRFKKIVPLVKENL